jgi:hypothetical protein
MQDRKDLRTGVDGQPQPQDVGVAAQSGSNFVQLQVREVQVAEGALMEKLSMLACAREPSGDGGLSKAENPLCSGRIQPFGQR